MEVNAFEWQVMCLAKLCGFHKLCGRHAEFTVMLTGLGMRVMCCHCNTGEEAEPKVYVTLRKWRLWRNDRHLPRVHTCPGVRCQGVPGRVSLVLVEILTCTCVRCKCRFAQNDMDVVKFCDVIHHNRSSLFQCGL